MEYRELEVSVVSDIHLATHASNAKKVLKYLKSIRPKVLVLNGDIIDSWRFSRNFFPKSHLKVIRQIIKMMERGVMVHYITGNHDEFLRQFNNIEIGTLKVSNQLCLNLDGKRTWILHGDLFDFTMHEIKWLAKFGSSLKGLLTVINKMVNYGLRIFGRKDVIIYKGIKSRLLKDKDKVSRFEKVVTKVAMEKEFNTVICGHTHVPRKKIVKMDNREVQYLNCGDWVENFTAAEYFEGDWSIFQYDDNNQAMNNDEADILSKKELYELLYEELTMASFQKVEMQ